MPKILFLTLHRPNRSPSQRFRFEQYLPFLVANGFEYEWSYLITAHQDKPFYNKGNYLFKFSILLKSFAKRIKEILAKSTYDIVFVQRECFMLGTAFFEKQFAKKAKLVFDFDDAIWLPNISKANKGLAFLKNPSKTNEIIQKSSLVLAGNTYLAKHAQQYNSNVKIIPTTIDTKNVHNRLKRHTPKKCITIGWTGTHSTLKYLNQLEGVLQKLSKNYKIELLIICDVPPTINFKFLKFISWSLREEINDLLQIDIGLMPLEDNEWVNGKCGFKILQYLALGIPAIASPYGVNKEIIQDGQNGFLAYTEQEWYDKIKQLINSNSLRENLGKAGRKMVEQYYSVSAYQSSYLEYLQALARKN